MCTVLLPPGDNPIAVNTHTHTHTYIYIYIYIYILYVNMSLLIKITPTNKTIVKITIYVEIPSVVPLSVSRKGRTDGTGKTSVIPILVNYVGRAQTPFSYRGFSLLYWGTKIHEFVTAMVGGVIPSITQLELSNRWIYYKLRNNISNKSVLDNSSCVTDGLTLPTISLLHNGDDIP